MKKPVGGKKGTGSTAPGSPDSSLFHPRVGIAISVLVLAGFICYANSVPGSFVLDDTVIILGNSSIQGLDLSHLREIFGNHYWKAVESRGGLYRPVTMFTYALNYAFGGEDPEGYHLLNLFLHISNSLLVFFVVEGIFRRRTLSFLTAAIFLLHPIRTEGVASVVGRAEILSAFFMLLAWAAYLRACRLASSLSMIISVCAFIAACLSKESALCFPALPVLTDLVTGKGPIRERFPLRRSLERYLPYGLAAGTVVLIRYIVLGGFAPLYINPLSNPLMNADEWSRWLTATYVLGRYLILLIAPIHLSPDYSYNQIPLVTTFLSWRALWPHAVLLLLLAGTFVSYKRRPALFFSGSLFFSAFLITSNWIRPIGTIMGERLMYFPALGFDCAVAYALSEALDLPRRKKIASAFAVVLLVFYGLRTIDRNLDWRNHQTLFRSAVRNSPDSASVQANYAAILLHEQKDALGAIGHARRAVALTPEDPAARFTLGLAYRQAGDLANSAENLESVVRLAPRTSGGIAALRELAEVHLALRQQDRARADYELLLSWRPNDAAARAALSRLEQSLKQVP